MGEQIEGQHEWIKVMSLSPGPGSMDCYWCCKCGTVTILRHYVPPRGIVYRVHHKEPVYTGNMIVGDTVGPCFPAVPVDVMKKFDEAVKMMAEHGITLRTEPVVRRGLG